MGSIQLAKYAGVISAGSGVKGQRKCVKKEHSGQSKTKVGKVSHRGEEKGLEAVRPSLEPSRTRRDWDQDAQDAKGFSG
jgi:hypothetical protein